MPEPNGQQTAWYTLTPDAVAKQLNVDPARGLSSSEAQERLQQYGPNQLTGKAKEPGWKSFLGQYRDFMQIILVGAAIINQIFTGELNTTLVLIGLTVFNAVMGLRQESKAEASLSALEKMMKNIARVRRDGEAVEIEAEGIVPGDIVLMEAGNRVPADGRLFVTATLEIEEAALTGESVASPKNTDTIGKVDAPLGDRHCMAYMNTSVTRGRAEMIVTTTGMGTEMGHIADLLNKTEADKTPLQKQLDRLTIIIASLAGLTFILMILLGIRNGESLDSVFIAGVALAISAIPTGMPAVVTTLYSMGTRAGQPGRHRQTAALGRDPGLRLGHLLRQDRHTDAEQDDGARVHGPRPEPLPRHRRRVQHDRRVAADPRRRPRPALAERQRPLPHGGPDPQRRRRQARPGADPDANGAVRRCPPGR
ncbi:MAG: HAD-IC family P-type ATPase [Caldilineales bacterium]